VRDEQNIVTRQGLTFINIPIKFENPTEADFEMFASVLAGLGARKVLVHCQINLRASAMVFLYRVIHLKEEPRTAYEAVAGVWSPNARWRRLIEDQLHKHNVAFFEPYCAINAGFRSVARAPDACRVPFPVARLRGACRPMQLLFLRD